MAEIKENKMDQISSDLAQKFIDALQEEKLPWSKGYDVNYHSPFNPATGTIYKGTSHIILLCNNIEKGYEDPRYMTFNNAKDLGGYIRKGEKGIACVRFQPKTINVTDKDGKVILNDKGDPEQKEILIPCPYTVFNVAQIDGLENVIKPLTTAKHQWDPNERAEALIKNSQAKIMHSEYRDIIEAPFYSPYLDQIGMPERYQFKSAERYYGTLLHELCHWTGHPSRLNRFSDNENDKTLGFASPEYAKEELRAEIGSSLLCMTLGIKHDLDDNSKAYVKSWVKVLENDPREILKATGQADKIASYLRQYDIVKEQNHEPLLRAYTGNLKDQNLGNIKQSAITRIDLNVRQRVFDFSKTQQEKTIPIQSSLER